MGGGASSASSAATPLDAAHKYAREKGSLLFSNKEKIDSIPLDESSRPAVLEVLRLIGVNRLHSCSVRVSLCRKTVDGDGFCALRQISTHRCTGQSDLVWHSFIPLSEATNKTDIVEFELIDHTRMGKSTLGSCSCSVAKLSASIEPVQLELALESPKRHSIVDEDGAAVSNSQIASASTAAHSGKAVFSCGTRCAVWSSVSMEIAGSADAVKDEPAKSFESRKGTITGYNPVDDTFVVRLDVGSSLIRVVAADVSPLPVLAVRWVEYSQKSCTKRLFLIRHGRSVWNTAQKNGNLVEMVRQSDHPLDRIGIEQAMDFRKRWESALFKYNDNASSIPANEQAFFLADAVFSSPLTRAVQTTLLGLEGHPATSSCEHPILIGVGRRRRQRVCVKLLSSIREVKNAGGRDSAGSVTGELEFGRACHCLQQELDADVIDRVVGSFTAFDPYDTKGSLWWSNLDTHKDVEHRIDRFLLNMQFGDFESAIIVGHSLFFRTLFQRCEESRSGDCGKSNTTADDPKRFPTLECLTKRKLQNGACVAVEIRFGPLFTGERNGTASASIVSTEMLFGTGLLD